MICLKSPKSSEFAKEINKQWSKILNYVDFIIFYRLIQLIFKYRKIKKIKLRLWWESNPLQKGYKTPAR